eukprot:6698292-Alexandrium_andersonii.AAC.1
MSSTNGPELAPRHQAYAHASARDPHADLKAERAQHHENLTAEGAPRHQGSPDMAPASRNNPTRT